MKLGFLGPAGTYTEEAAKVAMANVAYMPYPSIDAVFAAVACGEIERGLVPIENVIQGPVTETLDNLYRYAAQLKIVDMLVLPIQHAIGVLSPASQVHRVLSKDQALKQCSTYLQAHYPAAQQVAVASTSAAMEEIVSARLTDAAAIGSPLALQQYGLHILDRDIGNVQRNKTRFTVLGAVSEGYHPPTGSDATALMIYPHRDRIGLLEDILAILSKTHGLNLSAIHSRPDTRGAFRFYIEIEGHLAEPAVASSLAALTKQLGDEDIEVQVFGTYPRCAFTEQRIHTIGILGGTGQMGGWFDKFFRAAGYTVLLSGRRTPLTYEQCVAQADVVIINVPIKHTVEVIRRVGGLCRPGQLIADNTSIKTQPVAAMLEAVAPGVEVLGMHTVFGPAVDTLRQQNVIFTRTAASGALAQEFEDIFYKHGAKITHTTPENHDKQMAFHQNLEHFTKIVLAQVLRTHFGDPRQMDSYSSPNSRTSLATMGRILNADPELYGEIQAYNLQGPALIQAYLETAQVLGAAMQRGDMTAFTESMQASAQAFGSAYLAEMLQKSRLMQRHLV
ncbi:MAG: prephenate dehydrogenase/arogenate dehydrogenase family protein [Candidatus Tectimicrobiota bacterium]